MYIKFHILHVLRNYNCITNKVFEKKDQYKNIR